MDPDRMLYGYWRSSAAYRVRIALNLKGLSYAQRPVHLVRDGGQQHAPAYAALNPQQLVPTLIEDGRVLTQSLAIIEYLDEIHPHPALLPAEPLQRARVRALALLLAADTHPLGNLRVLQQLGTQLAADEAQRAAWMRYWIADGLQAFETLLATSPATGRCCHGDAPGLADLCLVPQVYNAVRWKVPLEAYPTLVGIHAHCESLPAFEQARPECQPDAVPA